MTHPGWRYHPAAKVALLVAVGIGAAHLSGPDPEDLLLPLALSLALLAAATRFSSLLFTLFLAATCVLAGSLLYATRGPEAPLLPRDVSIDRLNVEGRLLDDPRRFDGGWGFRLRVARMTYRRNVAEPDADILVRLYDRRVEREGLPSRGDRVLMQGDLRTPRRPSLPGEPDYGAWLESEGIIGTLQIGRARDVWSLGPGEEGWGESVRRRFRDGVREYCAGTIGGEEGAIALALVTGDRSGIDRELRDAFSATGTAHVLALSGLHVGVLALVLFVVLSWIPHRWVRFGLFTLALGTYVFLTGASPSILRASIMAVLFLFAYSIGRISRPLNTLGLAGLIILLLDPGALFDIGFQLSFAAVGGIILLYGPIYRRCERYLRFLMRSWALRPIISLLLLSITAQVGTLPLVAYYFGEISLLSPLLNILVVPLITIGFGATCAGLCVSWLPELPLWFGGSASLALGWGIDLVEMTAAIDWQGSRLPDLSVVLVILLLVGILWIGLARTFSSGLARLTSLALLLLPLHWFTPLEEVPADSFHLLPLTRTSGTLLLHHRADSLTLWYGPARESDSARVAAIAERTAALLEATHIEIVPVPGPVPDTTNPRLLLLNGYGPEYLDRHVPVLLSYTARRSADIILIAGHPVLHIPLHAHTAPFSVQVR